MKNRSTYPIVLEFYLIATIFLDVYVFFTVTNMLKIYSIVMFCVLVNGLINSIDNYNLKNYYNGFFCILDMVEYTTMNYL